MINLFFLKRQFSIFLERRFIRLFDEWNRFSTFTFIVRTQIGFDNMISVRHTVNGLIATKSKIISYDIDLQDWKAIQKFLQSFKITDKQNF